MDSISQSPSHHDDQSVFGSASLRCLLSRSGVGVCAQEEDQVAEDRLSMGMADISVHRVLVVQEDLVEV